MAGLVTMMPLTVSQKFALELLNRQEPQNCSKSDLILDVQVCIKELNQIAEHQPKIKYLALSTPCSPNMVITTWNRLQPHLLSNKVIHRFLLTLKEAVFLAQNYEKAQREANHDHSN